MDEGLNLSILYHENVVAFFILFDNVTSFFVETNIAFVEQFVELVFAYMWREILLVQFSGGEG